jgi:hypothetical protein
MRKDSGQNGIGHEPGTSKILHMTCLSVFLGFMLFVWLPALLVSTALADTPANCTFNDIAGKWVLYEGSRIHNSSVNCSRTGQHSMHSLGKFLCMSLWA